MLDVTSLFLKFLFIHKSLYFSVSLHQENSGRINWACSVQLLPLWELAKLQRACSVSLCHKVYKGLPQLGKANPILGIDMRKPTCPQVLVTFSKICFLSNENDFMDLYILLFAIFSQLVQNSRN